MSGPAAPRYVVGIDLGTTHTVVAFAAADGASPTETFAVDQPIAEGVFEPRTLLPSCLYAPLTGEATDERARVPASPFAFGAFAQSRGAEVTGRLVTSAKSWLPSAHVDRTAAILPWGERDDDDDDAPRISPVDASAAYLSVVRRAWDAAHPDAPLAVQQIVLTVPASFDDAARALTLEAARRAGVSVSLLEEPQAAFYDVLRRLGAPGLDAMFEGRPDAHVLVCDVGGGTTDFSLIALSQRGREVRRVAVGDHLLLGGDNMDLALAMLAERRLAGDKLTPARFAALVGEARRAKERALGVAPPTELSLAVLGDGAKLIGGARRATLSQPEIEALVVDGFFPVVDLGARPATGKSALVSFGLPYARDPAITKHLAAFLGNAGGEAPTHLLLCGGVFHAARIASRVHAVVERWIGRAVTRLPGVDPDLAVAHGAVAHGLARRGLGTRIGGGAARAYYLIVPRADGATQAVCVLPKGSEPGQAHAIDAALSLTKGKNVRIDVAASMGHDTSLAGHVLPFQAERFLRLPPLVAKVDGEGVETVKLEGQLSDIGTLSLACVEPGGARHVLELDLRPSRETSGSVAPPSMPPASEARLAPSVALIDAAFGKDGKPAKDLVRDLSKLLGERATWPLPVLRALGDELLVRAKGRRRSAEHERVMLNLASFCLRPGVGHADDASRMERFSMILSEGLIHSRDSKVAEQWLIAARRVAMGLDDTQQQLTFARVEPVLVAVSTKKPKSPFADHEAQVLELCAALERLAPPAKEALGHALVERVWVKKDPLLFRVIGRLGARMPSYASAHLVVRTRVAESWLDELRRERWEATPTLPVAAAELARRTGDRARDVADKVRDDVARRLAALGRDDLAELVREVVEARANDREAALGDALPPGLSFAD